MMNLSNFAAETRARLSLLESLDIDLNAFGMELHLESGSVHVFDNRVGEWLGVRLCLPLGHDHFGCVVGKTSTETHESCTSEDVLDLCRAQRIVNRKAAAPLKKAA